MEWTLYYFNGDSQKYLINEDYQEIAFYGRHTYDCIHQDNELDIAMYYDEDKDISIFHRHEIIKIKKH